MVEGAMAGQESKRVSTIELFFDLVFVFTITQLTHLVEHAHGPLDLLRALLVLALIWWMYDAYAWLTNAAGAPRQMRLVLIAAMAGFLVIALAIPGVFAGNGLIFGLAYLLVVLIHATAFAVGANRRAMLGIAGFNFGAAFLVIAAGLLALAWDWLLFLAAVALFVIATIFRRERGFSIDPGHFAERHGLIIIVALGESVVAIGTGAAERPLDARTLAAVVLALVFTAALWWSYFDRDDERAEGALLATAPEARPRIALFGYWYAHLAMIAGIVSVAAGVNQIVAQGGGPPGGAAWLLAGGLTVYLAGDVAFRRVMGIRPVLVRACGAAIALAFGATGRQWGGLAELVAVTALAIALLLIEQGLERAKTKS